VSRYQGTLQGNGGPAITYSGQTDILAGTLLYFTVGLPGTTTANECTTTRVSFEITSLSGKIVSWGEAGSSTMD